MQLFHIWIFYITGPGQIGYAWPFQMHRYSKRPHRETQILEGYGNLTNADDRKAEQWKSRNFKDFNQNSMSQSEGLVLTSGLKAKRPYHTRHGNITKQIWLEENVVFQHFCWKKQVACSLNSLSETMLSHITINTNRHCWHMCFAEQVVPEMYC